MCVTGTEHTRKQTRKGTRRHRYSERTRSPDATVRCAVSSHLIIPAPLPHLRFEGAPREYQIACNLILTAAIRTSSFRRGQSFRGDQTLRRLSKCRVSFFGLSSAVMCNSMQLDCSGTDLTVVAYCLYSPNSIAPVRQRLNRWYNSQCYLASRLQEQCATWKEVNIKV
eukprot:1447350-Pleurochrysis_carterae.AAC.2